jgi:serine/threonine-protein kinase SRK2
MFYCTAQENEARRFFQQHILALDYCHCMGIVNRDMKLENSLLIGSRQPLLKMCDFGLSKHMELDGRTKTRLGTPAYTGGDFLRPDR